MEPHPSYQECRSYVAAHLHHQPQKPIGNTLAPTSLTISRQTGARGRTIGIKLKDKLRSLTPTSPIPWTLFDEDLVQQVLTEHQLPIDLEQFMPDDGTSEITASINELLGRHPSLWTLFEKTAATISRLARIGHCIIVGRGGNEITQGFSNVIRVRLIGSMEQRLHQMTAVHGMSNTGAIKFIKEEDTARRRYIKQHFGADIDASNRYDLVINTDKLSDETIVNLLATAIQQHSKTV
ncbi:cytidylate kinase-like family protein [Coraliomargarita sp. SDUM461004]|uniref:Cytidylate kinase-like family protein n=1 Tax=Thalassobacterium sedimentorum TaxID=3041258 RepID=A0ABU1AGP2_9BACT|nr:cytidylate kinase-like family protein [Coraliomargarita sp. SDUM461004]MDQ8193759.1 cytidylate kinase-like family protein [Coraliomargarita sp. SDUM461004]